MTRDGIAGKPGFQGTDHGGPRQANIGQHTVIPARQFAECTAVGPCLTDRCNTGLNPFSASIMLADEVIERMRADKIGAMATSFGLVVLSLLRGRLCCSGRLTA